MIMILECKSCQKKFVVPDNAITKKGRLVQCSSCGNKWTQFPIKKKEDTTKKFSNKETVLSKNTKKIVTKTKSISKKTGPSIYSKEYLEKKHGIKLDQNSILKQKKNIIKKKIISSGLGFYSYLIMFLITIIAIFGVLHLTKEIIIFYFPFLENYILYLYETINNFTIVFKDMLNI